VTEDPEPPAADKPEPAKSFWGSFNQADMRMLVVTVAGTVVGGILLVMVLAAAEWRVILRHADELPRTDDQQK
jgi:hypothetical protein